MGCAWGYCSPDGDNDCLVPSELHPALGTVVTLWACLDYAPRCKTSGAQQRKGGPAVRLTNMSTRPTETLATHAAPGPNPAYSARSTYFLFCFFTAIIGSIHVCPPLCYAVLGERDNGNASARAHGIFIQHLSRMSYRTRERARIGSLGRDLGQVDLESVSW